MKFVLFVCLFCLVFGRQVRESALEEAAEIIEGIIEGTFSDIGGVADCIEDGEKIFTDLYAAITLFEKGKHENVYAGLIKLGDVLQEIPAEIEACKKAEAIIPEIKKIAAYFAAPEDLLVNVGKSILWHGKDILSDVTDMIADFKKDDYKGAGKEIGDIIRLVFLKMQLKSLDAPFAFLTGFYKKAFSIDLNLTTCQADVEDEWAAVEEAIQKIGKFDISSIIEGVTELIQAVPKFVEAFQDCESAWADLEKGLEELQVFIDSPGKIPAALTKMVTTHAIKVYTYVNNIHKAFTKGDYGAVGQGFGEIIALLLSEMK